MMTRTKESPSSRSGAAPAGTDGIVLLKQWQRQAVGLFDGYDPAAAIGRKQHSAIAICEALKIHSILEEEIFYPAFLAATHDYIIYETATQEHSQLRRLIDQILSSSPVDEFYDSRIRLLEDVAKQFAADKECPGGAFCEAQESDMDTQALGSMLCSRRQQLQPGSV